MVARVFCKSNIFLQKRDGVNENLSKNDGNALVLITSLTSQTGTLSIPESSRAFFLMIAMSEWSTNGIRFLSLSTRLSS